MPPWAEAVRCARDRGCATSPRAQQAPAVSVRGQQFRRCLGRRAPGLPPSPLGVARRARRTGRDRPTQPGATRPGNSRDPPRAPLPRYQGRRRSPQDVDLADPSGRTPRCSRGTRAGPRTMRRARRAMPSRGSRVPPTSWSQYPGRSVAGAERSGDGTNTRGRRMATAWRTPTSTGDPAITALVPICLSQHAHSVVPTDPHRGIDCRHTGRANPCVMPVGIRRPCRVILSARNDHRPAGTKRDSCGRRGIEGAKLGRPHVLGCWRSPHPRAARHVAGRGRAGIVDA